MNPHPPGFGRRARALLAAALMAALIPLPSVLSTVSATAAAVEAPADLRVERRLETSLEVAWSRPSGAELFRVVYSRKADFTQSKVRWTSGTALRIGGLLSDRRYHVRVRVVDGQRSVSGFSDPVSARTLVPGQEPSPEPPAPEEPAPEGPGPVPPPPAPSTGTLFGANYTTNSMVNERVYDGRARVARVFFGRLSGARFSGNAAVKEAIADGVDTFVISWKETDLSAIRTFLAGIPNGLTIYTSFNHEPENDHGSPGSAAYRAWSAEYRRQWTLQSPLMRAEGFVPTNILMAWTLQRGSGRSVAEWTPPRGTVDVFAFDAYYGQGKDPSNLAARMAQAARDAGVPRTGLAETGAPVGDSSRLANTAEMRRALIAEGNFAWGIYWNSAENGYDSRMDAAMADAWFGR